MNCQRFENDEEMLTRGLRLLAAEMDSESAPVELELKLRDAFRRQRVVVPMSNKKASRYWLAAVAAVLLIAMSVMAMWWRSENPQKTVVQTSPPQQVKEEKKSETPFQVAEQRLENVARRRQQPAKPVRHNLNARKSPESPMANHVTNEIATDFMPLGDMNPASLQDGGQIVRVNLRRSTLAKFGFPVNMDRYNENVKADVLLGVDGLARAIRFVQ